jgi:hypothetical protein
MAGSLKATTRAGPKDLVDGLGLLEGDDDGRVVEGDDEGWAERIGDNDMARSMA